jgi:hypothetical protein
MIDVEIKIHLRGLKTGMCITSNMCGSLSIGDKHQRKILFFGRKNGFLGAVAISTEHQNMIRFSGTMLTMTRIIK